MDRPPGSQAERRRLGATYTPPAIVDAMVGWARGRIEPARVVDPGCGSGRFLIAAGKVFPGAELCGVEIDPRAADVARRNLAAAGLGARVLVADYREVALDRACGPTLFIGNPPYVRHHGIDATWKAWLATRAAALGLKASRLAGLHVHFLLATAGLARAGDVGVFVTAAEWLDVNYGSLARALLAGPLGLVRLDLLAARVRAFPDAMVSAVIAGFDVGATSERIALRRVDALERLAPLEGGAAIARAQLARSPRWTPLFVARRRPRRSGMIELGELCRVHRGQVTGANRVWIVGPETPALPARFTFAAVTRARELFAAGPALTQAAALRRVIDLPAELDEVPDGDRALVDHFLAWARRAGAHRAYVARHRAAWWSVRLPPPAPILATYMARRPPAFVRNLTGARHINIAHGLYPRAPLGEAALDQLAAHLAGHTDVSGGRTYAGGLTKFEPREMERLLVPRPE